MSVLPNRALFMAPMVDLSHEPMRELVRGFGGCDLFYSEMLNARIVPNENPLFSQYLKFKKTDDLIMQIVGNDPEKICLSAARLDGFNPWGIDINMGCYLKKITCHGWGVSLMKDIGTAEKIIVEARKTSNKPLSVKIRIGIKHDMHYLKDFGAMIEAAGADFIVIHARIESDGLTRPAKWEYIACLKESLSIPVIGNGDVKTPQEAINMFNQTSCDGVMIGRASIISPWVFRDIKDLMSGNSLKERPDVCGVMMRLSELIEGWFAPDIALKRFSAALPWLAQNLKFGHHFVKKIKGPTLFDMRNQIINAFANGIS